MTNAWHAALDATEFHLVLTQAALAAGNPPPPRLDTVYPTVPLPPELAGRARALLALTHELESMANGRLDRLRVALAALPTRRAVAPRPRTGTFVDIGA
jgi:hypothetical protein